ncbi:MAG: (2Fe-2S)-binding protein [Candidatus Limnocylindrales bacterium]|nr:(2Fe-2S)-binding protein [Candidatus Limnocylindrales bacterium]
MVEGGAPSMNVTMTVNRTPVSVEIDPSEPLAYTLRNRLGLTGTKVSCDVQACGACAVLVDGLPRSACTYLTYEARGHEVLTVEGLAPDEEVLHPIQQAFIDANAFQCGFCTSGMLVAAYAFLTIEADLSDEDLIEYMSGNLCRCTGYLPIVAAILPARKALAARRAAGRG